MRQVQVAARLALEMHQKYVRLHRVVVVLGDVLDKLRHATVRGTGVHFQVLEAHVPIFRFVSAGRAAVPSPPH